MSNISPSNSTISVTAIAGGGLPGGGSGSSTAALPIDDFFPPDPFSFQDRKDEAIAVLRSDLMAALNKEVKSLDEDNWKFEGPRSRIHLISRPGDFLNNKHIKMSKDSNSSRPE